MQPTNIILQSDVAEVKVVKGSEAYNEALIKEAPQFWNWTTWRLFGCLLLGCFAQTMVRHLLHLYANDSSCRIPKRESRN